MPPRRTGHVARRMWSLSVSDWLRGSRVRKGAPASSLQICRPKSPGRRHLLVRVTLLDRGGGGGAAVPAPSSLARLRRCGPSQPGQRRGCSERWVVASWARSPAGPGSALYRLASRREGTEGGTSAHSRSATELHLVRDLRPCPHTARGGSRKWPRPGVALGRWGTHVVPLGCSAGDPGPEPGLPSVLLSFRESSSSGPWEPGRPAPAVAPGAQGARLHSSTLSPDCQPQHAVFHLRLVHQCSTCASVTVGRGGPRVPGGGGGRSPGFTPLHGDRTRLSALCCLCSQCSRDSPGPGLPWGPACPALGVGSRRSV